MKDILQESLQRSITYSEYRRLVTDLLNEGKSTSSTQSEELLNYSKLNDSRMKRLDKTFHLDDETTDALKKLDVDYLWLVITEGWCGDASQSVPIMNAIAETASIDMKIVLRDENEALMNHFLTNGGKAIPKLIMLQKETLEVLNTWGPRPKELADIIIAYKEQHGTLDDTIKKDTQVWYNTNKGKAIVEELLELLGVTQLV
ncbi:MAG: thioredoxin family protein [Flavobacteriaceae bacterium]|nr:thioredoxin family protein [Flavobacteriaceae bacterium]